MLPELQQMMEVRKVKIAEDAAEMAVEMENLAKLIAGGFTSDSDL